MRENDSCDNVSLSSFILAFMPAASGRAGLRVLRSYFQVFSMSESNQRQFVIFSPVSQLLVPQV